MHEDRQLLRFEHAGHGLHQFIMEPAVMLIRKASDFGQLQKHDPPVFLVALLFKIPFSHQSIYRHGETPL